MVRTLNGSAFSRVLRADALAVVREQDSLNRINVFPVRDADTGANLAATLKAAASRLGSASPDGVGAAARAAADGALDGARGNSGAIVAQFLHGLAGAMERRSRVDGPQFACAALGVDRGLNAIIRRAVRFADGAPARAMVVHSGDQAGRSRWCAPAPSSPRTCASAPLPFALAARGFRRVPRGNAIVEPLPDPF